MFSSFTLQVFKLQISLLTIGFLQSGLSGEVKLFRFRSMRPFRNICINGRGARMRTETWAGPGPRGETRANRKATIRRGTRIGART